MVVCKHIANHVLMPKCIAADFQVLDLLLEKVDLQ